MALGTDHITTTTAGPFAPANIYARTYFEGAKKNKPALAFFRDYSAMFSAIGGGVAFNVPKPAAFTKADKVVGTAITPQNPTTTAATITVNQNYVVPFVIEDGVGALAHNPEMQNAYIRKAIDALMNAVDAYLLALASGFATTQAATNTTGDNLYAFFQAARKTLNATGVPPEDRAWFLGPDLESRCLGMTQFTSALYRGSQPVQTGDTGGAQFLGAQTFLAQNIASATVTTTTDTNVYAHRDAIGYVVTINGFETGRSIEHQGDVFVAKMQFGASVIDSAWGVKLTSTY